jgi:hypothetical protein
MTSSHVLYVQELSPDIGEALCELLDGKNDVDDSMSR